MPFDGNGHYSLPAGNPVVTGTVINSTTTNNTLTDISTALSTTLTKDGQTTPTGNLPMGGFKHTGAGDGVDAGDYATIRQLGVTTGGTVVGFKLTPTGAATQNMDTVLRNIGAVSATQFMLPADIADLALATPLRDQSANLQAAIDSGVKKIVLPTGNYRVDNTIRLKDGVQLIGASSIQGTGTSIRFSKNDGTHCFDSDPALFLSGVLVQGMEIVNTANSAGTVGAGDAFHVFALTNNCRFANVLIRNFGGSAFSIGKQTTSPADKTACSNVYFDQVFVVSCGGYAFDVAGYTNALWSMCDLNSCATGYFRFQDGTTNQTMINVVGLWLEGTQAWTALTVFDMQDTKGQMLNLIACNFTNGRAGTSRVVKSTTSSCRINAPGITGFGWTTFHEDTPTGANVSLNTPMAYFYQPEARQLILHGTGPVLDLALDTGGTVDQRRFRVAISGNDLLWSARDDTGASVRNLWKTNFVTGAHVPAVDNTYDLGSTALQVANGYVKKAHFSGSSTVFDSAGAGTPEAAVTAAVGSTYRRTDGGAGTTFYVKETGTGNTGWVAK